MKLGVEYLIISTQPQKCTKWQVRECTVAACLLILSRKMQMLFLASSLSHSFTSCFSPGVAGFVHNYGLGAGMHTSPCFAHCPYCFGCARKEGQQLCHKLPLFTFQFLQHYQRKNTQISQNHILAAMSLPLYGLVHKIACLPRFCRQRKCMFSHKIVLPEVN